VVEALCSKSFGWYCSGNGIINYKFPDRDRVFFFFKKQLHTFDSNSKLPPRLLLTYLPSCKYLTVLLQQLTTFSKTNSTANSQLTSFSTHKFNNQLTSNLTHTQTSNLSYKSLPSPSQLTSNLTTAPHIQTETQNQPKQPKMQPATPITTAAPTEVPQPQEARGKFLPLHPLPLPLDTHPHPLPTK